MRRSIALLLLTACSSTANVADPYAEDGGAAGAPSGGVAGSPMESLLTAGGASTAPASSSCGNASAGTAGTSGATQDVAGAAGMAGTPGVAGAAGSATTTAPDRSMPYYEPPTGYCAVFRGERMVILEWTARGGWQLQATQYECYSSGNPVRAFGALSRTDEPADGTWASGVAICRRCFCEADSTWWQGIAAEE